MNVGVTDLSKKSYLRKTALFKKLKSLRSHKNEEIRVKIKKRKANLFQHFC